MTELPRRRSGGLVERSLDGETVVYDLDTNRVTHLDGNSSVVWRACDGRRDVGDIAEASGLATADVEAALLRLEAAGLVESSGVSRRQLLARAGAVAWAVPLVSIAAPTAAMAASPVSPAVGTIRHTCRGAHTQTFFIPLVGLPALTNVTLVYSISGSGGGSYVETKETDASGAVTFSKSFTDTGPPVSSRTVVVTSVSYGQETIPLGVRYTGTCP